MGWGALVQQQLKQISFFTVSYYFVKNWLFIYYCFVHAWLASEIYYYYYSIKGYLFQCQGSTIQKPAKVYADLNETFGAAMCYVILSRISA